MIAICKTISASLKQGYRLLKVSLFSNAREPYEAMPYGYDGNPIKDMDAIYAPTSINGIPVIIGYINTKQLADVGENRTYSTDSSGALKFNIWQRNDGTCLLGTSDNPADYIDNLIRYAAQKTALDTYFTNLNAAISAGVASAGGTYTPPSSPYDPSLAKIDEIKTQ